MWQTRDVDTSKSVANQRHIHTLVYMSLGKPGILSTSLGNMRNFSLFSTPFRYIDFPCLYFRSIDLDVFSKSTPSDVFHVEKGMSNGSESINQFK